jgi:hypothetical protein
MGLEYRVVSPYFGNEVLFTLFAARSIDIENGSKKIMSSSLYNSQVRPSPDNL